MCFFYQIIALYLHIKTSEILNIQNLSISFISNKTKIEVVHDVSFSICKNEILGIVGESGSGKSVSSLAIMGLLPKRISEVTKGSIQFKDKDLLNISEKGYQALRGNDISMIFQEPMSSLNPSMKCGHQVAELTKRHTSLSKSEIKKEVI